MDRELRVQPDVGRRPGRSTSSESSGHTPYMAGPGADEIIVDLA